MTTSVNKVPLSINYTSRDYYALREELISRVQARVPNWLGNDPSDFGVALIEAFAYMGDILNYYIDRVANESYISTATQRDTLLNLASMYGYKPSGYVSAVADIEFTNNFGYTAQIGGTFLENGVAQLAVAVGHPFVVDDYVTIAGVPTSATVLLNGVTKTYNTSVYNGTYKITAIGVPNAGQNAISYKPEFTITGITTASPSGTITSASGDGYSVTYTTTTPPKVGSVITITGVTPSGYNLSNVEVSSVTDNTFSVLDDFSDTYTSGGSFTGSYLNFTTASQIVSGQKIKVSNVVSASGNRYNGIWTVSNSTLTDVTVNVPANKCSITEVHGDGTKVTYSGYNDFVVGQKVSITGVAPSSYTYSSGSPATVASVTSIYGTVTYANGSGGTVTYLVDKEFTAGQLVTMTGITPTAYNLTNAIIATASPITATITNISYDSGSGNLLVTTSGNHGMIAQSYVTISGNGVSDYNVGPVLILTVPATNQFTIAGTDNGVGTSGTATVYRFTVTNAASGTMITGGYAAVNQFTVTANTTTTVITHSGTAQAIADGSYTSGGVINFADVPTLIESGLIYNIGTTLVPEGTELVANVTSGDVTEQVTFSTTTDTYVPYKSVATVSAVQGKNITNLAENAVNTTRNPHDIAGELLGKSTGETDQSFAISNKIVDMSTIRVFVDNGAVFEEWEQINDLIDYDSHDKVFTTSVDSAGVIYVNFGDGVSGTIPLLDKEIKAVYVAGGGAIGNVKAGSLINYGNIPYRSVGTLPNGGTDLSAFIRTYIKPNNPSAGNGGSDVESDDSIRYNAPRSLRSLNRAVSLKDFSDLSLSVSGVGKANAIAEAGTSVTLYVAPTSADTNIDATPGLSSDGITPTDSWLSLKNRVDNFLSDKTQVGTTVTISPPLYTNIKAQVKYTPLPQYSKSVVEKNIVTTFLNSFSYNYVSFADVITPEEIEFKLRQADGVANLKVVYLYREGGSGKTSLVGEANEIFVFNEAGIVLDASSSEARLGNSSPTWSPLDGSGNSTGSVAITPTYSRDIYNYKMTLPSGTAKLRITPTATDTDSVITVNNIAVTTGNPYVDVSTGIGNNVIRVVVTAPDGVTIDTYTITATRSA
jgi:hypothetical protein